MCDLFREEKYWCMNCGEYSMILVNSDESDYKIHQTFECTKCFEYDYDSIYLD